ncbi:MAG: sulfatase-like hydrolase/transferase [Bacteroidota bacterium]
MLLRGFTIALLALLASPLAGLGQAQPNVLIVIADDVGVDALGMYGIGTDQPNTPNLDALAAEGIRFDNAWAYPTCAPTRAAMLTGLYGNKTDVLTVPGHLDLGFTTLFEQVAAVTSRAYAVASIGKWHLARGNNLTNPNDQGADHFVGFMGGAVSDYYAWERVENGVASASTAYTTSQLTDEAIAWIGEQRQPWLLWLAHGAAHTPFHVPPSSLFTRTRTASNLDQYLATIEALDHEIGRLLDAMPPAERANTLVLFVGDNGTPRQVLQGFPSGRGKGTLYEGGLRVPLIAAGAGVTRVGETETAPVHVLDVFATVTEVLGTDLDGGINNSFSFKDLLSDAAAPTRPYNLSEVTSDTQDAVAIRDAQYKLIASAEGQQEFYDLLADPFERNDLTLSGLTAAQLAALATLEAEARAQTAGWSCNDGILNGDEQPGDCSVATSTQDAIPGSSVVLWQNAPNPFRSTTTIRYTLPEHVITVRLAVFDMMGRRVATLVDEAQPAGLQAVSWHGTDAAGQALPSGVYLYQFRAGAVTHTRKMVLLR